MPDAHPCGLVTLWRLGGDSEIDIKGLRVEVDTLEAFEALVVDLTSRCKKSVGVTKLRDE